MGQRVSGIRECILRRDGSEVLDLAGVEDVEKAMKLLLCEDCWDVFKLSSVTRKCFCGRVYGRYIDNEKAEVSSTAISLALGNGSLLDAIGRMRLFQELFKDTADREFYIELAKIDYAWVRPNTGPGNPHTQIIQE